MVNEIVGLIRDGRRFLLTTHESPDGDALGATLGLASFLRHIGKEVVVHAIDPVPALFSFLPGADTVTPEIPPLSYDVSFVLDVGEERRAGLRFSEATAKGVIVNIDHHATCERFGDINLIDPVAAATGILVHRIVEAYGYPLDRDTALCLYVAIITDTGSFRYSNANPEAFSVSSRLIACGINAWDVAEKLYENQPKERLLLLAEALRHLRIDESGLFASLAVTLDMYDRTGASPELTDGFVNYPRSIAGVEVALFFRELAPDRFKVGFRSKGNVDVARLAQTFGGGGHHNAAGCVVDGPLDMVRDMVSSHLHAILTPR
ncbi:MAG: bifunctional oligoribonuclease/PAP phosphatase NrnA [Desulfuromonadia bacterium]